MAIILGLLIVCLGLYFLTVFFQLARLEKSMHESVTTLERYMISTYSMTQGNQEKAIDAEAGSNTASGPAGGPAKPA